MSLPRSFFARPALVVAPELLGCLLTHEGVTVRLTEVEAYAGEGADPGSHAFRGRTPRTEVMFGEAGHLYVYFSYGMHWCANAVCGDEGVAQAVLLRAGEVVAGNELAASRRPGLRERDWARGPARLTRTLGIDRAHDGIDVCAGGSVSFAAPPESVDPARVRTGPRVGVSGPGGDGTAYPYRFWIDGEPTVSAYRPAVTRRRTR
ncbi:DNA-3-methyladenine glycosylase [Knoellia flava]|uniref:Putative 3-methyladenine DNA glycosylase n=1 Tax=Knoellia flava TaxID=913969 RepID=A0A8H9FS76_9MICO|nr:DNA-3-methyladenine glycosylase [Knoellia flava]GGB68521.1 putative 3-methyladenine DNA glycosylase [Knoellia flava]